MASALPSKSYARIDVTLPLPDLIEVQLESFKRLKVDGGWRIYFTNFLRLSRTTRG